MNLIYNVTLYTMNTPSAICNAIAWENGIISATGDKDDLKKKYTFATETDGGGATIIPGLIDPHIHFFDGAMFQGTIDLTPANVPDIATMKVMIREEVRKTHENQWIAGQGYDPAELREKRSPNRYDLDEVCPDQPAVVFHYSVHECVVNSRALEILGINKYSQQPYAGEIVKYKNGEPTGRLIEMAEGGAISTLRESIIDHSEQEIMDKMAQGQKLLFSHGLVRIGDPAVSTATRRFYEKAQENETLIIPVHTYPCDDTNMFALPEDRIEKPFSESKCETIINGPVKMFLDGADRAAVKISIWQALKSFADALKTAFKKRTFEPVRLMFRSPFKLKGDFKLHFGVLMVPFDKGRSFVEKAIKNNYSVAMHAIGNEAVEQAADLLSGLSVSHKESPPPRIEHALFLTDTCIKKIGRQKIAVVTQPEFLSHMDSANLPSLPGFRQLPLRTLIDEGIRVAGSSDWPVVSCNPFNGIERSVTRRAGKNEILQKEEAITVHEAISMYTSEAAFILGISDITGTLEAGKRADFVLLSEDPFRMDAARLSEISVLKTYLGGEMVYSA